MISEETDLREVSQDLTTAESFTEKPVTGRKKKIYPPIQVEIVRLHPEGFGVGDDSKIAVIGGLPGETIHAELWTRKRKKRFYKAVSIDNPNPQRIEPVCEAAGNCGGCSLQHLDPLAQINFKLEQLKLAFEDTQPEYYLEPLTGPVSTYRRKARLGVKFVEKKGKVLVGFREKLKPYIAELDSCKVLHTSVGERFQRIASLIENLSNPMAVPQIEVAVGDHETALIIRHLERLTEDDEVLIRNFARDCEFSIYLQPGNPETVCKFYPADGVDRLKYSLPDHGLVFDFHPLDFTQVNLEINRKMIDLAIELLSPLADDQIFDGFCGIGNFSLPVAKQCREVVGVELSSASIDRAGENAEKNGVQNVRFYVKDLFEQSMELSEIRGCNKVLLDPPRSGALEVCKILARDKVERVVYVSCNPVTLARDAKLLVASGYRFDCAGVIDMFPHTTHVESVACFSNPN